MQDHQYMFSFNSNYYIIKKNVIQYTSNYKKISVIIITSQQNE